MLSGNNFLPCSPPESSLKHRNKEVKTLYDLSLHSTCKTSSFDRPDTWPNFMELWVEGTPCNKLPYMIIEYWDGSYLKCHYSKSVIVGVLVGPARKIDELMFRFREVSQNGVIGYSH